MRRDSGRILIIYTAFYAMIRTPPHGPQAQQHVENAGKTAGRRPATTAWHLQADAAAGPVVRSGGIRKNWKVSKTMQPDDRGAIQLAQTYGPDLVCVRHRLDNNGRTRHVTVELLIHSVDIPQRKRPMVKLKLGRHERELRAIILAAGGSWDAELKLWHLPRRVANILKLQSRIVSP